MIKIVLLYINTDVQALHFCYCLKKDVANVLNVFYHETLKTVMHYHQKPYVRNITGLLRIPLQRGFEPCW